MQGLGSVSGVKIEAEEASGLVGSPLQAVP